MENLSYRCISICLWLYNEHNNALTKHFQYDKGNIMPRPRKKLTAKQATEVESLAEVLTTEQIADYFGISRDTFYQIMKRQEDVSIHYKKGKAKIISEIAQNLITKARQGDLGAMIFFLKTQAGWREKTELMPLVIPETPKPTFDFSQCSADELVLYRKLAESRIASNKKASIKANCI